MQVSKWGNRLAIRLPQAVVDALQVKEGDEIDISVEGARAFAVDREAANQRQDAQGIEDGRAVKREICIVVRRVGVRAPDEPVFDTNALLNAVRPEDSRAETRSASVDTDSVEYRKRFRAVRPLFLSRIGC